MSIIIEERGSATPYCDYAGFLRERHGGTVYRVPVDLGLGCPHRTEGDAESGCTYCGGMGSRAMHLRPEMTLRKQVQAGIHLALERYRADAFMAYFQAFTSTNASLEILRPLVNEVLDSADFKAVTFSTRPDCLPEETVDFLAELAQTYDTWVELGVQTSSDSTLARINRGHDFACSVDAIHRLADRGIPVAAHVIIGLPGEDAENYRQTAQLLAPLPLSGIKIHNLHIIRGTPLAKAWRRGEVDELDEHQYAGFLTDFLRHIPAKWPIMRLICETPREELLAPRWWTSKGQFIQHVGEQMRERGWRQGDLCHVSTSPVLPPVAVPGPRPEVMLSEPVESASEGGFDTSPLEPIADQLAGTTRHGSGVEGVLEGAGILGRLSQHDVTLLDVGFGLGTVGFGAIDLVPRAGLHRLRLVGMAVGIGSLRHIRGLPTDHLELLDRIGHFGSLNCDWGKARIHWGDPRRMLARTRGVADVIVLEPPAIERHPELFTADFLRRLLSFLAPAGVLVSPCGASPLRNALLRLGMEVGKCHAELVPGGGTLATRATVSARFPLSHKELRIIRETVSGVPYRDPDLTGSRKAILGHHAQVVARLRQRGWPHRLKFAGTS